MASQEMKEDKKKTCLRAKKNSKLQKQVPKLSSIGNKSSEPCITRSLKIGPKNVTAQNELQLTIKPQSKKTDMVNGPTKVSFNSVCKRKKALPKLRGKYSLRSLDRIRILRPKPNIINGKTTINASSNSEILVVKKKKRGKRKAKNSGQDDLSRFKNNMKYMLNRMNYEQSLIDAYSGEGWKGQSAEKIKPEKELDRAKSEILRCKLKIREIFQHLDSLLAEGRIHESLFDSDEIDSENIFCGKCGSKDVSADDDIILCDGICERGFHQKCLNPPLLSEDIPAGDEGWLCPQCDCKVDCIDMLNEFQETDLSIEDSMESIFPEAARLVNRNGKCDGLDLPSDDSEDGDYDPNALEVVADKQEEGSSQDKSDSSSSSYDSAASGDNMCCASIELPSDDSEDDDFDPDVPDPDKEIQKNDTSSDESDFTSDSDDFCAELKKMSYADEASAASLPKQETAIDSGRDDMKDKDKLYDGYSEQSFAMLEIEKQDSGSILSHKRDRERLDYKMLHHETYVKSSSDSSDDDDWNETSAPKKLKKTVDKGIETEPCDSHFEMVRNVKSSSIDVQRVGDQPAVPSALLEIDKHESDLRSSNKRNLERLDYKKLYDDAYVNSSSDSGDDKDWNENESSTPVNFKKIEDKEIEVVIDNSVKTTQKSCNKISSSSSAIKCHGSQEPHPSGHSSAFAFRKSGAASKKLYDAFQENQYPTKENRESLAQELRLTCKQVDNWFKNRRHSFHLSAKKSRNSDTAASTGPASQFKSNKRVVTKSPALPMLHQATDAKRATRHVVPIQKKQGKAFQENQHLSREKKKGTAQGLSITIRQELNAAFRENKYPTKEKKESLALELNLTFKQVSNWFRNTRHSFHVSAKRSGKFDAAISNGTPTSHFDPKRVAKKSGARSTPHRSAHAIRTARLANLVKKKLDEVFEESQYPSREKKEEMALELGMSPKQVSIWFRNARVRSRSYTKQPWRCTPKSNKVEASCRTNVSPKLEKSEEENSAEASAPDKHTTITITTPTHDAKPVDQADQILVLGFPRGEICSPKSHEIPLNSPVLTNGSEAALNSKGKKVDGTTSPSGAS